ncbi:hypothetical protein NA78x_002024 [Anatilimnocola sp. NA78]|uniref:hypothetical protein n=1 Tax=Anatilimnocola sp. NA78 TaxID=3415683 RepID=UPI003CE5B4DF
MLDTVGSTLLTSGQMLAQTGTSKTMLGYMAVIALIAVGLALVCRPSGRMVEKKKKK